MQKLLKTLTKGYKVIDKKIISEDLGIKERSSENLLSSLSKGGILKKVNTGRYLIKNTITDNSELANLIDPESYIGGYTSLKKHGLIFQENGDVIISLTPNKTKDITINGNKYVYIKIDSKITGFGNEYINNVRYSDKEKAILDIIYLHFYSPRQKISTEIDLYGSDLDFEKMKAYSNNYPERVQNYIKKIIKNYDSQQRTNTTK